jgi:hypothetical protein
MFGKGLDMMESLERQDLAVSRQLRSPAMVTMGTDQDDGVGTSPTIIQDVSKPKPRCTIRELGR